MLLCYVGFQEVQGEHTPILGGTTQELSDWFRNGHVTEFRPIRSAPEQVTELLGMCALKTSTVAFSSGKMKARGLFSCLSPCKKGCPATGHRGKQTRRERKRENVILNQQALTLTFQLKQIYANSTREETQGRLWTRQAYRLTWSSTIHNERDS